MVLTNIQKNIKQIEQKKFNVFIGCSLGNKYFREKKNLKKYIMWALKHSKEKVLIIIVDKIHAINYEVRNKYNPTRSLNVSLRKGKDLSNNIKEIMNSLAPQQKYSIKIISWAELEKDDFYQNLRLTVYQEFECNAKFKKSILQIVKDNVKEGLEKKDIEKLAKYVLDELPVLLTGITYENKHYNLHPYPKLSKLHELIIEIQDKSAFRNISKKIKNKKTFFVELN